MFHHNDLGPLNVLMNTIRREGKAVVIIDQELASFVSRDSIRTIFLTVFAVNLKFSGDDRGQSID